MFLCNSLNLLAISANIVALGVGTALKTEPASEDVKKYPRCKTWYGGSPQWQRESKQNYLSLQRNEEMSKTIVVYLFDAQRKE
jgi:hypothetical protein